MGWHACQRTCAKPTRTNARTNAGQTHGQTHHADARSSHKRVSWRTSCGGVARSRTRRAEHTALEHTALEPRIGAYERCGVGVTLTLTLTCYGQQAELPDLKAAFPAYGEIHRQVLQDRLTRRVDRTG